MEHTPPRHERRKADHVFWRLIGERRKLYSDDAAKDRRRWDAECSIPVA